MHGIIFNSFKNFIEKKGSPKTWEEIHQAFGSLKINPSHNYKDDHFFQAFHIAADLLQISEYQLMEEFGTYLIRDLICAYKRWMLADWDSLEFLLNVEGIMHTVARALAKSPAEEPYPPILIAERIGPNQILIKYISNRKMCALAKGLITGAGHYYNENLQVNELFCTHRGDPHCLFEVTRLSA